MGTNGSLFLIGVLLGSAATAPASAAPPPPALAVNNQVTAAVPASVGGILGARLDLWRRVRLWRVVNNPFLLDGFAHPPGKHPWQGEHVGKWLHAATLAAEATGDVKLAAALQEMVVKLVATQQPNGYVGTYAPAQRFYNQIEKGDRSTWDIWTHRYVIHGLLSYSATHDDPAALQTSINAADLLARAAGPPDGDITRFGTRWGLSSAVLLESVAMLYQRTGDARHLAFARHLAGSIERNPHLRIIAAMRAGEDVTVSGDGKAYQLMAVLLGYLELHRCTGEKDYLDTAVTAWEKIQAGHVNITGGPWGYQVAPGTNHECFAAPGFFHPTCCVETCSTTTWIQLCLSLFELTGGSRYADAAERALFNQLLGAQSPNGNDWAYHSMLNMPDRGYEDTITCCASSGPRALEVFARHLVCASKDAVIINSYVPVVVSLARLVGQPGTVIIEGGYPFAAESRLRFDLPAPTVLTVDFRLPAGAASLELSVNGKLERPERTAQGMFRLRRTWNADDRVAVRFDFPLRSHFQTGSDGVRWIGFSWGPLALAQSVTAQTDHPLPVLASYQESDDGNRWLEPAAVTRKPPRAVDNVAEAGILKSEARLAASTVSVPSWRLKAPRRIILVPYFLAGTEGGGVRTMFPTR
ncbi:MAG: glycoside hydrolase family 127 protein [Opitutaceae bacterium]|nr:glycoside hydrolase family 127 protein [Opitutaceae bacterium]